MPRIRKKTSNRLKINDRAKIRKKVKETKRKKAKEAKKNPQWKSRKPKDPGIPNDFPYKDQILGEVAEQRRLAAEEKLRKKEEREAARLSAKKVEHAAGSDVEDQDADMADADSDEAEDVQEEPTGKQKLDVGAESIASLSAKLVKAEIKARPKVSSKAATEEENDDDEEVPILANRDLPSLGSVLDKADVVIEVLDARDPMAFRSKSVEDAVKEKGKKLLFVLNKIDTCPREAVIAWSKDLRAQHPTFLFRSASAFLPEGTLLPSDASTVPPVVVKGKGKAKAKLLPSDGLGAESIIKCLSQWATEKKSTESTPLSVAVVGLTNSGKSSFINSLVKKSALPVYTLAGSSRGPTTTELVQEIPLGDGEQERKIVFMDTPGLSFQYISHHGDEDMDDDEQEGEGDEEEDEEEFDSDAEEELDRAMRDAFRAQDILLRNKGRIDRLKDPRPPVDFLVSRANAEDLMLLYSLPAFVKGDPVAFLSGVARANQLVKKKGELDLNGAARVVLRDWSIGKLSRYTLPPSSSSSSSSTTSTAAVPASTTTPSSSSPLSSNAVSYDQDETILATLDTRKEMRKRKTGSIVVVRFAATSEIEQRQVGMEQPWPALAGNESEEEEQGDDDGDDGSEGGDAEGMDVDEEEEDEEEEEGEDGDGDQGDEEEESVDEEEDVTPPPPTTQKRKRGNEALVQLPSKKVAIQSKKDGKASAPQPKPLKGVLKNKTVAMPSSTSKSSGKTKSATVTTTAPAPAARKTANIPIKKKAAAGGTQEGKATKKKSAGEPEAYDFGKYF